MVHPGATTLPPLRRPSRSKFSFLASPDEQSPRDYFVHAQVPNNTPKPLLPMWASSLTSPVLGKQRLVEETWVSSDVLGTVDRAVVDAFMTWMKQSVLPRGDSSSLLLRQQLRENVELELRCATRRGVYAKRRFQSGEVILSIPLSATAAATEEEEERQQRTTVKADSSTQSSQQQEEETATAAQHVPWGGALNSETLRRYSLAAQCRLVPSYGVIRGTVSVRHSDFDPTPHPLFIDQLHCALLLACEKAEGPASPLHPYLQLLGTTEEMFDEDHARELYRGVLEPFVHMEYTDHCERFRHYLRQLHKRWWEDYEVALRAERCAAKGTSTSTATTTATAGATASTSSSPPHDAVPNAEPFVAKLNIKEGATPTLSFGANSAYRTKSARDAKGLSETDCAETSISSTAATDAARPSQSPFPSALKPPPSLEDVEWAFRIVLSRQRMLPHVRQLYTEELAAESSEALMDAEELDPFARGVMQAKWAVYRHVFRAIDEDQLTVNDFDPSTAPTVVPLLDMFMHPPSGVANATFAVEDVAVEAIAEPTPAGSQDGVPLQEEYSGSSPSDVTSVTSAACPPAPPPLPPKRIPHIVVRASEPIDEDDELTLLYPRCYSVSYALYRFGFLPLRRREDDMADLLRQHGLDGNKNVRHTTSDRGTSVGTALPSTWWGKAKRLLGRGRGRGDEVKLVV